MTHFRYLVFFFLLLSFVSYGQHDHKEYSENEKQEAERLVRIFDSHFSELVLEKIVPKQDVESFVLFSRVNIASDHKLFFAKVLHKELFEKDIDTYIEQSLLRIYKNIVTNFMNEKGVHKVYPEKSLKVESIGEPCNNVDFESGTTNGWDGWIGSASTNPYPTDAALTAGFFYGHHTIQSGSGFDPTVGGSLLPVVAPGGNFSLRLENLVSGGDLSRISQTFLVNPANANFTYQYAVVLEDPTNSHTDLERPYFKIKVTDGFGNEILCGKYEVLAKPPITGFSQVPGTNFYWRNWTSVSIPLSPFVGQNVTVEFTASDCSLGGHLGYAYIDGSCFQSRIESVPLGLCSGFPYTLIAPSGYASYLWSGPGIISSVDSQYVNVNKQGTYVCTIESVSGSNCLTYLKANVGNSATVSAGPDFHICKGGYAQLNGNLTLTKSFTWSPASGMSNSNVLNPVVSPLTTTTYYLEGCGITDTATVFVDEVDFDITPSMILCSPSTVTLNATPILTGNYAYSWTPSLGIIGANTANPLVTVSSSSIYKVVVTNLNNGCSNSKKDTVSIVSFTKTEAGSVDSICLSSSIKLTAKGGSNFVWTDINGNAPLGLSCTNCSNPVFDPIVTSTYIVTSNLTTPCINKDTVTIVVLSLPIVTLGNDTTLCNGGSITFNVTNPGCSYLWSTGDTTPILQVIKKGKYAVTVNNGRCINGDTVNVKFAAQPKSFKDTTICLGEKVLFYAGKGYLSYLWQDSSSNSTFMATANSLTKQFIKVQFKDNNNCTYKDSANLSVIDCTPIELYIPNLITPNSDSKNDKFFIKGLPPESILSICNRWGELVYKSSNYDNSWEADNVSDGIFYYNLELKDNRKYKGWLEVIR